jgi:hypothetical protein
MWPLIAGCQGVVPFDGAPGRNRAPLQQQGWHPDGPDDYPTPSRKPKAGRHGGVGDLPAVASVGLLTNSSSVLNSPTEPMSL